MLHALCGGDRDGYAMFCPQEVAGLQTHTSSAKPSLLLTHYFEFNKNVFRFLFLFEVIKIGGRY